MSQCKICETPLYSGNTSGYCRKCWNKSPEKLTKQAETMRRRWRDPETRERLKAAGTANLNAPGVRASAIASVKARRTWEIASQHITTADRARGARRALETKLGHIPRELRDEYRRLTRGKKLLAAEASDMIREQHERDMARFRARLLRYK